MGYAGAEGRIRAMARLPPASKQPPIAFGTLLQRFRQAAALSQEELAERAGLSRRGVSDLERGMRRAPYPATLRRLADALRLSDTERAEFLGVSRAEDTSRVRMPPLVAPPSPERPGNLPRQLTSFVGHEHDLVELRRLLASKPLLTLSGPGGIGKTRLALQLARDASPHYADGVWLVEL